MASGVYSQNCLPGCWIGVIRLIFDEGIVDPIIEKARKTLADEVVCGYISNIVE